MMKQATLKIDLDTILYNCKHLKCYYKKKMMAVLKDDAYGLGLLEIANHIKDEVDMVLVSKIEEIKLLKENAFDKDILYLNVFDKEDIEILKRYQVHVIVDNLSQLEMAKEYNLPFHLKINCGMNRLGLYKKDIEIAIKKINKGKYNIKGVMAHFQDEDKHHESYVRFKKYVEKIKIDNLMIHCHASNSLSTYYENITTHIRVGIKLYGLGEKNCFLHNALTLTSPILRINNVDKGEYVGYDKTYCCKEKGYLYPYKVLFSEPKVIVLCLISAIAGIGRYGLLTWIPSYFDTFFEFDLNKLEKLIDKKDNDKSPWRPVCIFGEGNFDSYTALRCIWDIC